MKKSILLTAILFCLISVLLFVSCGEGDAGDSNSSSEQNVTEVPSDESINEDNSLPEDTDSVETPLEEIEEVKLTTDTDISEYLVRAASEKNGLYGYVDIRTGKYVIEPKFTYADISFGNDGWASVSTEDCKTFINTSGEFLFKAGEIDDKVNYEGDCLVVKKGDKCYLYHGADYVCELKCDDDSFNLRPTSAFAKDYGYNSMYTPDKYIVLGASKKRNERFCLLALV